jgi:transcriptional regulator with XRE-family HTH domain
MAQKYFKANHPKLESLRIARGMSRQKLADKAIVSPRTLDSIVAGKQAALSTFSKLAKALDAPVESILEGYEDPVVPEERLWKVTITISTPFDRFDETKDLPVFLSRLYSLLGGDGVSFINVKPGSTKINVALTNEQVFKIVTAYLTSKLDVLKVKQIIVPAKFPEDSRFKQFVKGSNEPRVVIRSKIFWERHIPELVQAIQASIQASKTRFGDS